MHTKIPTQLCCPPPLSVLPKPFPVSPTQPKSPTRRQKRTWMDNNFSHGASSRFSGMSTFTNVCPCSLPSSNTGAYHLRCMPEPRGILQADSFLQMPQEMIEGQRWMIGMMFFEAWGMMFQSVSCHTLKALTKVRESKVCVGNSKV